MNAERNTEAGGNGPRSVGVVSTQTVRIALPPDGFRLQKGGVLRDLTVAYEAYGTLSAGRDNVVYICHALTGDAHVAGRHAGDDGKPGWWDDMVGPGKGIDTDYYYVVCANILGGCKGTTGPCAADPATGRPYGSRFPEITVRDIVAVQKLLLDHLGVRRLAAVVGGSFGGMQVLEWSVRYPDFVDRCICIASGASLSAQALAFDLVARDAITSDPSWAGGDYYDKGRKPSWGLAHARKIGHITYLSPEVMQEKFGREKAAPAPGARHRFQVESYLEHQGQKLVERFDANSYLAITQAMDTYDLEEEFGGLEKAFETVKAKFLIVALSSDWLFPPEQSVALADALLAAGKHVSCCTLRAPYGHDAFLVDIERLADVVRAFLPWVPGRDRPATRRAPRENPEHACIRQLVQPGARIVDLGCGNGELLSLLTAEKQTRGFGVDIEIGNVIEVIDRGHDVFQGDLDTGLSVISDGAYDAAILGSTLQESRRPRVVLREVVRVAREGIVSFPNFANWRNRLRLGCGGRMPKSGSLPFEWYETPNIHLTTLSDFVELCRQEGIEVREVVCIPGNALDRVLLALGLRNVGAERVVVRIGRSG